MREAAEYLVGEHDFKSFCGTGAQVKTTVRTVKEIQIEKMRIELLSVLPEKVSCIIWFGL